MSKSSNVLFDPIAEAYYSSTPPIQKEYIELLQRTFHIQDTDHILDLGCGSGDITLSLTNYSSYVAGVDISKKMIEMAHSKDTQHQISWHHASVDDFDLGEEQYTLIFSFESFHLFSRPVDLIRRCAKALMPGGALCIGWRMYEWDVPLKDVIKETFEAYGIDRGTWGRWTCPTFSQQIAEAQAGLRPPQQKQLFLPSQTPIEAIANQVLNNSRSAHICDEEKTALRKDLLKSFRQVYPNGLSTGNTEYTLVHCRK